MLRPTQSPIIYIQQLGRGLRIHKDKPYVVILDFIGNYEKNYNIPLALSDDRSYNKSETRKFVSIGDAIIPGNSTISFDEISKKKIYESIDRSDFNSSKIILQAYRDLKMKLGRIPDLIEFIHYGSIDPLKILSKYGSYHNFLKSKDEDYSPTLSSYEEQLLEYFSKIVAPGKRPLEIEMLELIESRDESAFSTFLETHPRLDITVRNNLKSVFDGNFYKNSPKIITGDCIVDDGYYGATSDHFHESVQEIMELGRYNYEHEYSAPYDGTNFVLNKMYTYDDVCRLMNWSHNINAINIGGYKFDSDTNTFCVFINYVKGEDVVESQRYEDHFENRGSLIAISKSTEGKSSKNMCRVENHRNTGMDIHLFVRKNKNDESSKEFYYLGKMDFDCFMNDETPVKIRYKLREEVRFDLFEYFLADS